MGKISEVFKAINGAIGFTSLPVEQRRITFYSEGKNYLPHLESLLKAVLENTDFEVCYVSSSTNDPGLHFTHPRLNCFYIGMGFVRDYFFQSLETAVMVMTMPDLHQYQVKRSKNSVHYVYVPHSLVSLHMVYRSGAFDHYDTFCAAGPHHVQEVGAIEEKYNLPKKHIVEFGYPRLDRLIEEVCKHSSNNNADNRKKILIAPSWGSEGLIESGLANVLVEDLLSLGHEVVLRPHPQTIKFAAKYVKDIVDRHQSNQLFTFEDSVAGQDSLLSSDIMVSDWSGAALEYSFALHKPVVFCDVPRKVNNPNYQDIDLVPLEVSIRDQIGVVWDPKKPIAEVLDAVDEIDVTTIESLANNYVFNINSSSDVIVSLLKEIIYRN